MKDSIRQQVIYVSIIICILIYICYLNYDSKLCNQKLQTTIQEMENLYAMKLEKIVEMAELQKKDLDNITHKLSNLEDATESCHNKVNRLSDILQVQNNVKQMDNYLATLFINEEEFFEYDMRNFDTLLRLCLHNPATFYHELDSLKKCMFIYTAPDKSFKIYSFTHGGGTQKFYKQYIQYKDSQGKVVFRPFYLFGLEGEDQRDPKNPKIYDIYPLLVNGTTYYLLLMKKVYSNTDAVSYIAIATFKNGTPEYHPEFFPKEFSKFFCIDIFDTPWGTSDLHYNPRNQEISYKESGNWRDTLEDIRSYRWKLLMH